VAFFAVLALPLKRRVLDVRWRIPFKRERVNGAAKSEIAVTMRSMLITVLSAITFLAVS
jgi:hypothetical protein